MNSRADRLASERLRAVVNSAYDAILTADRHHTIRFMNAAAERMFGYEQGEAVGQNLSVLMPERLAAKHEQYVAGFVASPTQSREMRQRSDVFARRRNGEEFRAQISISKIEIDGEVEMVAIVRDFNETARLIAELHAGATTDFLTGIANRRSFMQTLEGEFQRAQRYGRPLSVLMLDVDHFKKVNDSYGHGVGDQVLKAVANGLGEGLRGADKLGRYGGEEFAALLPETHLDAAVTVSERMCEITSKLSHREQNGTAFSVTISIGVATLNDKHMTIEALLAEADAALYRAKETGRNRVCCAP